MIPAKFANCWVCIHQGPFKADKTASVPSNVSFKLTSEDCDQGSTNQYTVCSMHGTTGGNIALPLNAEEDAHLASEASNYWTTCKADKQGGKVAWLGIHFNDTVNQWTVSSHEKHLPWR